MRPSNVDIGLPVVPGGDTKIVGLAYCSAAATLVVTLARTNDASRRFFIRRESETEYREVCPPDERFWFDKYLAVAPDAPFAFVMLTDRHAHSSHVYSVALPDGQLNPLPEPIRYPTATKVWISQVVAASPDAAWLHVVAAEVPQPRSDGSYSVTHSLARMEVSTGALVKIVNLLTPYV